jgi:predicted AlkP superfamily pyrophosphatase or phosphodiesterase
MPSKSRFRVLFAFLVVFQGLGLLLPVLPAADPNAKPSVRLAVLVLFDQMRGDYLMRWDDLFGDGGFHRLEKEGVWFQNCHYPYSFTITGPGHASVHTGTSAYKHGIIGNDWYDRAAGTSVYCVGSTRYQRVPPLPVKKDREATTAKKPKGVGAPDRLLAPTLADALKDATAGKGRVVALSWKDRAAVLPGGKKPDACYWLDPNSGIFVTSTYYRDRLHPWVAELNRGHPADRWFGRDWTRLLPDLDYERRSGPDDAPGEGKGYAQGRTFPHPMTGGLSQPGKEYYEAVYTSPFGNELILELVKRAIDAEELGTRDVPDLLCVSFSCNDPIGHQWGPDSQEVLDVTLRADRILKGLLDHLDARVGKGRYVLGLTADHGVCPTPESSRARGKEAGRISEALLTLKAEEFLHQTFVKGIQAPVLCLEAPITNDSFYLNRAWLKAAGLDQAKVEEALAGWLKEQPGIETAYTRTQLLHGVPENDVVGRMVRRSFHPERSGDVIAVVKPYHLITSNLTGTGHGTPHEYDTHVPLLVSGPGIGAGIRRDAVVPQAATAILAQALGIKPPALCEATVPAKLFAEK